jgi:hypothetical protein
LEGLKQRSRVRSSTTRAPSRGIIGHKVTTSLWRLCSGHQPSYQVLGSQQGEHGRLLHRSPEAREQILCLEFHHIVRDNNVAADVLSKLGSTRAQVPVGVFVHKLHPPSIPELAPTTIEPAPSPAGQEVMMIDVD